MTLGTAIIVVAVLYLIDKHNRWEIAAKVAVAAGLLAATGVGGYKGFERYRDWQIDRYISQRVEMKRKIVERYQNVSWGRDPTTIARNARPRLCADATFKALTPDFLFEIEAIAFMMAATPVFMRL